jgi:DNA processing protein
MAVGIDFHAHAESMRAKGLTVAFSGAGLDIDYPSQNHILREEIEKRGMILSEFPPGEPAMGWHFPIRNRLMSAISDAVFVVEGSIKSGSLITANHALLQGKDVFALMGDIFDSRSEGTFKLLQDGAIPIMSALDIVIYYIDDYPNCLTTKNIRPNFFSPDMRKNPPNVRSVINDKNKENLDLSQRKVIDKNLRNIINTNRKLISDNSVEELSLDVLSLEAKNVLEYIGKEAIHVDELQQKSSILTSDLLSALTELEIEGFILSKPGRLYLRKDVKILQY